MNRLLLVKLHRYTGLTLALLLALLGLSGSILVFDPEIDAWLNPDLFEIERPGAEPLPATELIRRVEASDPRIEAYYLALDDAPRKAAVTYVAPRDDPATGDPYDVDYDEVFIDPVSGTVTGRRLWGECCFERPNFVPFMYKLHNRLLLPMDLGRPLLGGVAILWVALLAVGGWLTWPASGRGLRDWRRAWAVRRGRTGFQSTLTWHRAGGLWMWPVLVAVALSGVVLGFEDQARGLVNLVSPVSDPPDLSAANPRGDGRPAGARAASYSDAVAAARAALASEHSDLAPAYVSRASERGLYRVRFGDPYTAGLGEVTVYVAEFHGRVVGVSTARGASAGDLVMNAMQPLHAGRIGGMPGRLLVFLSGIGLTALSVTGVVMWVMRRMRRDGVNRRSAQAAPRR